MPSILATVIQAAAVPRYASPATSTAETTSGAMTSPNPSPPVTRCSVSAGSRIETSHVLISSSPAAPIASPASVGIRGPSQRAA